MNPLPLSLAGCVILNDKSRILLLHRNTALCNQWEIPGGKLKPGETEEIAAARELQEELNMQVKITRKLRTETFMDKGRSMTYTWFLAAAKEQPAIQEPQTFDRFAYFSTKDMNHLALSSGAACFVSKLDDGTIAL